MLSNQKYRVNTLAKDLDLKSKDVVDILNEKGIEGKAHMAVLEPEEFEVVVNSLSEENQFVGINDYMDGKVTPKGLEKVAEIKPKIVPQPKVGKPKVEQKQEIGRAHV